MIEFRSAGPIAETEKAFKVLVVVDIYNRAGDCITKPEYVFFPKSICNRVGDVSLEIPSWLLRKKESEFGGRFRVYGKNSAE